MQLTKSYQLISTISTTYGGIRTYAKYTSQSSTDNTTTYYLQQRYYVSSSYTSVSFDSATGVVDGTSKKYTSRTTMAQGETTIQTVKRTITHNEDGSSPTKSVASSWTASFGGGGSATASITFPNITRMSLPTLNQPTTNDPLFELGSIVRLYTNRPVATYTHTLYMNINGNPVLIDSDITDYVDIETNLLANQLYQAYPSSARIEGTFTLYTYNGATLVGSANCDYLTFIKEGATFSVAYKDTNGTTTTITGNNQKIIQNKSTLQFNITNASVQHYASGLASVDITINGETRTTTITGTSGVSKDITWGTLDLSQNTTATITLYDSRGVGTTHTLDLTMLSWQTPTADITLNRQQNFYTETDITVNANYSSLDSNNTITIKYYLKRDDAADYGAATTITDGTTTTFNADNTHAWDVKIEVIDRLATNTYYRQIGIGTPIMFIDRNKRSVAINGFPTSANDLFVNNAPIVESGSNANGSYMKFYNGFMICMINEMEIARTGNSTLGGASVNYGTATWTYPETFTTPITAIVSARDSGSGVFGAEIDGSVGTTGVQITAYGANTTYKVNAVAFGMWR